MPDEDVVKIPVDDYGTTYREDSSVRLEGVVPPSNYTGPADLSEDPLLAQKKANIEQQLVNTAVNPTESTAVGAPTQAALDQAVSDAAAFNAAFNSAEEPEPDPLVTESEDTTDVTDTVTLSTDITDTNTQSQETDPTPSGDATPLVTSTPESSETVTESSSPSSQAVSDLAPIDPEHQQG